MGGYIILSEDEGTMSETIMHAWLHVKVILTVYM